jgi:hypothetical protein
MFEEFERTTDPLQALMNPKTIPQRILSKCKQILVSLSPIITKTCWNRRFGGDVRLCAVATDLLTIGGLLEKGNFVANGVNTYTSWMKKLPPDPKSHTDTLRFQHTKLNIFNVTWQEYASSFKQITFGRSNKTTFISMEAAEILRTTPYTDVGFFLDEAMVSNKHKKRM